MSAPPPAAPPPHPSRSDWWQPVALLLVAVGVHAWVIAHTSVTARDSIGFARYALALGDPARPWDQVLRENHHPPGYPLAILAVARTLPAAPATPVTEHTLLAAQVASAAAGVLLVLPVYWLGRKLFHPTAGFWAALLLQLLPVFAHDTADGLSDGLFLLLAFSAVACRVRALDRSRGWPWLLACGLLSGLAYLVRPEGVLVPLAASLTLVVRATKAGFARTVGGLLAVGIGFAVPAAPYMATIGGFTIKPAFRGEAAAGVTGGPAFAETVPDPKAVGTVLTTGKEWLKVGHYGVAVYALIGLALSARRVWREPRFWLPVLYAGGQVAVVLALGWKKGYVSERHLLPVAAVGVLFAAGGMPAWFLLWADVARRAGQTALGRVLAGERWPWALCAVLAAVGAVPVFGTRLHDDRLGHKLAGAKLGEELAAMTDDERAGVVVIDHYQWCQFFSGRATTAIPPDPPPAAQRVVYVVLEMKNGRPEEPDFGSERHRTGVNYYLTPPGGSSTRTVFAWPADAPKVVLVEVTLGK